MATHFATEPRVQEPTRYAPDEAPRWLLPVILFAAFALYAGSLQFQFVYDDWPQIIRNPFLTSFHKLLGYFTSSVWNHLIPGKSGNYYRPLFMMWLGLNRWLFGLHPFGWHLTTVALHVLVTWQVYALTRRLYRDQYIALFTSAIFAVHAVHNESVAWISGVTDPLVAVFMLGAFQVFLLYDERRHWKWLATSLVLFALAMLSKETAVVLPGIIVVYYWTKLEGSPTARVRAMFAPVAAFAAVLAVFLVCRQLALGAFSAEDANPGLYTAHIIPFAIAYYFRMLVAPLDLKVFHDNPEINSFHSLNFVLPLLISLAVIALLIWLARKHGPNAVAVAWLTLPILPVLVGAALLEKEEFVHDRYLYIPSMGFAMLVAWGIRRLHSTQRVFNIPVAQAVALLACIAYFGLAAALQLPQWTSNFALYSYGVKATKRSLIARAHLGAEFLAAGDHQNAFHYLKLAHDADPEDWRVNFSLGVAYYYDHIYPDADHYLTIAARIQPGNSNQFYFRGMSRLATGQLDAAEADLLHAVQMTPGAPDYHEGLGNVWERKGDIKDAIAAYEEELKIAPKPALAQHVADLRARNR